jgi:phage shock protein C
MNRSFALDRSNSKLLGVCSGIANSFNVDALLVRLGFVITVLMGFGLPILLYFAIALLAD